MIFYTEIFWNSVSTRDGLTRALKESRAVLLYNNYKVKRDAIFFSCGILGCSKFFPNVIVFLSIFKKTIILMRFVPGYTVEGIFGIVSVGVFFYDKGRNDVLLQNNFK
jgi:hypothetical protein